MLFKRLLDFWVVILLFLAWQMGVTLSQVNAIVMPSPLATVQAVLATPGLYLGALWSTVSLAVGGLAFGMGLGVLVALLSWYSRILRGLLTPVGIIFSSVPVVALIPILSRMFGYGGGTVLAVVAIISFFPFFVFVSSGLRALPAGSDNVFTVFGSSRWNRLIRLAIPSALPNFAVALRITAPNSILAAMVGEFLMKTGGLGNLLSSAADGFRTEQAIGASLVATFAAVMLFSACRWLEALIRARTL
ncbi:ABC transporter, permease protein [Ketogulonicigenium robustum]|uniref:ABC transporter, permease protein n=2 Tax=Ketogulonicigenium robustum TaxID=92947 RepID=A0A1W6NW18_9RHOB|nr:ABC transporter, permease protein [Ketogulonicigenium robustum]